MPRILRLTAAIALVVAVTPGSAPTVQAVDGFPTALRAELRGLDVFPGPGDPDGLGTVEIQVIPRIGDIQTVVTVEGIDEPLAAHLHAGAAGTTGPEIFHLGVPSEQGSHGVPGGPFDPDLIQDIADNPESYYVDVHSVEHPDGAIRGQLGRGAASVAAYLRDNEVVPGPGLDGVEGVASVLIDATLTEVCVMRFPELNGLADVTAVRIHEAPPGSSGPPVLNLPIPGLYPEPEVCTDGHDPAVLEMIADEPWRFYLIFATADYPDGAVRGQLENPSATPIPPPDPCPATVGRECILPPGTYTYDGFATDLTYTTGTTLLTLFLTNADGPDFGAIGFRDPELGGELNIFDFRGDVFNESSPCELLPEHIGVKHLGTDPESFIEWLSAHPYLDTTEPIAVEYGGLPALQIDATVLEAGCILDRVLLFQFNPGIDGGNGDQMPGTVLRIVVQRVGEQTIVLLARDFSGLELSVGRVQGGETFIAEAQRIVDSIRWAVQPAAGPSGPPLPDTALSPIGGS